MLLNIMSQIKKKIKNKFDSNYKLFKLYHISLSVCSNLSKKNPIIIHQMGKVGSSSLYHSLKSLKLNRPVFHVHYMVRKNRDSVLETYPISKYDYFSRSKHLGISEYLEREVRKNNFPYQWEVITMIRDPVAQNISSFFQSLELLIPNFINEYKNNQISSDDLERLFLERYNVSTIYHNWFDVEVLPVFDIDVYSEAFPKQLGYKIYEGSKSKILLLKLEKIHECVKNAIKEFLGIDSFILNDSNISANKSYFEIYEDFKKNVKLPSTYVDSVYNTKQVRHFYTDFEIQNFINKLKTDHKIAH